MKPEELLAKEEVVATAKRMIKDMGYRDALTHVLADHMSKLTAMSSNKACESLGKRDEWKERRSFCRARD